MILIVFRNILIIIDKKLKINKKYKNKLINKNTIN